MINGLKISQNTGIPGYYGFRQITNNHYSQIYFDAMETQLPDNKKIDLFKETKWN